jgi:hypothetical protein
MRKKYNRIAVVATVIIITLCALALYNKCFDNAADIAMLPIASGELWNNENINGIGNSEGSQEYISIPGYSKLFSSKDKPDILLVNPLENTVYFQYAIYEGRQLIHKTELIKPGDMLRWDAQSVFGIRRLCH